VLLSRFLRDNGLFEMDLGREAALDLDDGDLALEAFDVDLLAARLLAAGLRGDFERLLDFDRLGDRGCLSFLERGCVAVSMLNTRT